MAGVPPVRRPSIARSWAAEHDVLEQLLTGLVADGHILLEDLPGLGKTLIAQSFASALGPHLHADPVHGRPPAPRHHRRRGATTPPGRTFTFRPGPIFTHVLLADEINRAPPKVQSALLEAMQDTR